MRKGTSTTMNMIWGGGGRVETEYIMKIHAIFKSQYTRKIQKPILGMRFKEPGQVKTMLCNYVVANGY